MALFDPSPLQPLAESLAMRGRLSDYDKDAVLALPGESAQLRANLDFVRPREKAGFAFLVIQGWVARFGETRGGARQITGLYLPGDVVNLNAVIAAEASCALQTLAASTVLKMPLPALRDLVARRPSLGTALWRVCARDAAIGAEWALNISRRAAAARLAHLLCETGHRILGRNLDDGEDYTFPVTQAQLGEILGLTSVHVNRTLRYLREMCLATMRGGRVTVHDWRGLARLGEFQPGYLGSCSAESDTVETEETSASPAHWGSHAALFLPCPRSRLHG
jgi:CRP-like cAMP-binding protein